MKPIYPIALISLASAFAQTAPVPTTPSTPPASDTVTLSPFEVRGEDDTGYRATNTLDGSRLKARRN